jgi:hypothetical protein
MMIVCSSRLIPFPWQKKNSNSLDELDPEKCCTHRGQGTARLAYDNDVRRQSRGGPQAQLDQSKMEELTGSVGNSNCHVRIIMSRPSLRHAFMPLFMMITMMHDNVRCRHS